MQLLLFNTLYLDDADMRQGLKGKGKLNGIIKDVPNTQVTISFFFVCWYLFINFIFKKRVFLTFHQGLQQVVARDRRD